MRNLIQYPITEKEVEDLLNEKIEEKKDEIGSTDAFIFHRITVLLKENPDLFDKYFKIF